MELVYLSKRMTRFCSMDCIIGLSCLGDLGALEWCKQARLGKDLPTTHFPILLRPQESNASEGAIGWKKTELFFFHICFKVQ